MNYWLMKSEPDVFGIDDLKNALHGIEPWDGVRNYQARNMMRDDMKAGDLAFFYHSNCKKPGIAGIMEIVREGYPDRTALDRTSRYYDPKCEPEKPRWYCVDVRYVRNLKRVITLSELKDDRALTGLPLIRRGNRLSVMPVSRTQWEHILALE